MCLCNVYADLHNLDVSPSLAASGEEVARAPLQTLGTKLHKTPATGAHPHRKRSARTDGQDRHHHTAQTHARRHALLHSVSPVWGRQG